MISLFYGGASSGKSAVAEDFALSFTTSQPHIYLATLRNDGSKESNQRITRHQKRRANKPFYTVELLTVQDGLRLVENGSLADFSNKVFLLDCLAVMLANSKFISLKKENNFKEVSNEDLLYSFKSLISSLEMMSLHLIIVTQNLFSGAEFFQKLENPSINYLKLLAAAERILVEDFSADFVEISAGRLGHLRVNSPYLHKFIKEYFYEEK